MCTRYWTEASPELRPIVEEMKRSPLVRKWQNTTAVKDYGEIRPTDVVPVIAPNPSGSRAVYPMKWGYTGKSLLLNARSETAAEKPTFLEDWTRRRCIVPASWYFEWEHRIGNENKRQVGVLCEMQTYPLLLLYVVLLKGNMTQYAVEKAVHASICTRIMLV